MLKKTTLFPFALSLCLAGLSTSLPQAALAAAMPTNAPAQTGKQRLIVLTDVGADPDDTESLVRLMLYSNEIDIEGLIATTSVWMKSTVNPQSVREVIGAYGQVRDNLLLHDKGYPQANDLLSLVRQGLPVYGMAGVGEGRDSPGSDRIIQVLQERDDRPVWVTAWGGTNTLAQALYKIKHTMSEAEAARLIAKLRVHTISDQDDSGTWIRTNFPNLFYIVSPGDYGASTWIAINSVIPGIDNTTISNKWLADNIQQGHGPLGAIYPDVGYGMEGDTPSFLSLIPNGLNDPEHPDKGGGAAVMNSISRSPMPMQRGICRAACLMCRRCGRSGPMRATTMRRRKWGNTTGPYISARRHFQVTRSACGAGGMISRTISPRGWRGQRNRSMKRTIRPSCAWMCLKS
ncbi:MAG: DUF1593 domain-containing protein [Asticcacaulis sp.]|nr:DUF1593 domain-containing protein [Asticcacaulis sp.]